MRGRRRRAAVVVALAVSPLLGCTCAKMLAFGTATKFGLDISQRPDQTVDVSMGYDRIEVATIPAKNEDANGAAGGKTDTYSVLGSLFINYGNPWMLKPVHLNQFFATGQAARTAATSARFRKFFGRTAGSIQGEKRTAEDTKLVAPALKAATKALEK